MGESTSKKECKICKRLFDPLAKYGEYEIVRFRMKDGKKVKERIKPICCRCYWQKMKGGRT